MVHSSLFLNVVHGMAHAHWLMFSVYFTKSRMIRKLLGCQNHRAPVWFSFKRNRFSSSNFQQNFIELILWVLLVCLTLYIYKPAISSFSASLFTGTKKIEYDISNANQLSEMKLTVQLVLQASANGSFIEILANQSSSPYIVPPKYRERFEHDFSDEFLYIPEVHSHNISAVSFRENLAIVCRAPFAIELIYEGLAAPRFGDISTEKKYRQASTLNHTFYEITLHFNKYELEEMDTGRYICQATEKQNRTYLLENKKTRGFIDIFVPGEMKLLHNGLWNDHGLLGGSAVASPIIVYYDVGRGGKEITLPCGVSHPQTKVSLYHKGTKLLALENKGGIVFNALEGFRISFKLIENLLRGNSDYNQFACKIKGGIHEMLFNIVIKDATKSHISPSSSLVSVGEGQLPVQLFVCEADEPVMIRWLDGPPAVTLKEATKNESSYKLSFIATPMQYNHTKGSMSRIQCSRKRDGMIIHVWEWVGNGVAEPFLRYNRKRKELSCCMNSAQQPPQLVVIACSTMLECQVKGSFQPKIAAGGWNGVSNNAGCSVWTVPTSFQAGVILCNQVNSNPFRDLSPNKEFPPVFFKWNDDVVVISKHISSKPLQDLITTKLSNDAGRMGYKQVKVECIASTFVSAKGLRWTMHTHNGEVVEDLQLKQSWGADTSISYQEDYSLKTATVHGTLLLRYTAISSKPFLEIRGNKEGIVELSKMEERIASITCEAPLWNATDGYPQLCITWAFNAVLNGILSSNKTSNASASISTNTADFVIINNFN
ncbi:unnamed protein product [Orchesella dallaii]|uniref:Ig-like domain-containing protein n=1 Tax=Orchesella dallaii TaxID=48710 RepID=A0ABP1QNQ7_9HEXA